MSHYPVAPSYGSTPFASPQGVPFSPMQGPADYSQPQAAPTYSMRHPLGAPPPVRHLDGLPPPPLNYPPAPSTKSRKSSVNSVPYAFPIGRAASGMAPAHSSGSSSFRRSSDFPPAPPYPAPPQGGSQGAGVLYPAPP